MSILSSVESEVKHLASVGVEDVYKFWDVIEPEMAIDAAATYSLIRPKFVDALGYIKAQAVADVKVAIKAAVTSAVAQHGDSLDAIPAAIDALKADAPGLVSMIGGVAVHVLVSTAVGMALAAAA